MNQIVLDNINPMVFEKIQRLAQKHNRSLEDEIKAMLEKVAETEVTSSGSIRSAFERNLKLARQAHGEQFFSDSVDLLREDRRR